MNISEVWKYSKIGIETFLTSIVFFYSHLTLILVSLIPSLIRSFQMWNADTPFWLEGIVLITRIFLFLLILSILSKVKISELKNKSFWDRFFQSFTNQLNKNWPYGFIAQIAAFIILLYGLGNLFIMLLSGLFEPTLELMGIQPVDPDAAYNASVYFLKNMSVIPLAIVYILVMCGAKSTKN